MTGLTNGTEYTFSVIAESEFGSSPSSGTVTGTPTLASPYALHAIGYASGGYRNNVERITVDTTGNATDFGDLSGTRGMFSGVFPTLLVLLLQVELGLQIQWSILLMLPQEMLLTLEI